MAQSEYPFTIEPDAKDIGRRLDHVLMGYVADISRVRLQQVIDEGKVLVNQQPQKPSYKLRAGDRVTVLGPAERPPLRAIAEDIPLDVVFEDEDLAVINKPAGMMVHAGAGATDSERSRGTLVNALLHRFEALSCTAGELRPGIVHRLDRETSGLILVAKNDSAHRKLSRQFETRTVKKTYVALVHGSLKQDTGTMDAAISRDAIRRTRMTTRRSAGREAVSHWKVLRRIQSPYGKFTLTEVQIDTGRTHQIRVHMSSLGHPVVGDTLYGAPRELKAELHMAATRRSAQNRSAQGATPSLSPMMLTRNFLHAGSIEFSHPRTGDRMKFERGLPEELKRFLASLEPHGAQEP